VDLSEWAKEAHHLLLSHPNPSVLNGEEDLLLSRKLICRSISGLNYDAAFIGELGGIGNEVVNDLSEATTVPNYKLQVSQRDVVGQLHIGLH